MQKLSFMEVIESDILIIGGGLAGLAAAHYLRNTYSIRIVESRARLGGRIITKYQSGSAPQEMGATWLGKKHVLLNRLLEELNIGIFEQILGETAIYEPISTSPPQLVSLPPNNEPSYRIKGGSSTLINKLSESISKEKVHLSMVVRSIEEVDDGVLVKTDNQQFKAQKVISTLPPYLLVNSMKFIPELPESLVNIAQNTHTWMGESIKIGLTFKEPFWREKNLSGTIFSAVGPIPEMYDHSNYEDSFYSLKGFLNGSYFSVSKEERLELIMNQLKKYYREKALDFVDYNETVWRKEPFTFLDYKSHVLPHQNNGHPVFRNKYMNGRLFLAGAETSERHPGYMDGAVRSAAEVVKQILLKKV